MGSREADTLTGTASPNRIAALEGNDTITQPTQAFGDSDEIYGDEGNDTIDVQEGSADSSDTVNCGPGKKDKVFFDQGIDAVTGCEIKKPE